MMKGVVLAMGTFDGVHRGHRAVVGKAVARARALGLPAMVMTFRRPPRFFFHPPAIPSLLTTPEEKDLLLREIGADRVELLTFGKALASQTAKDFFQRRILRAWKAREVVVGYNFAFGKGREGDPRFLKTEGKKAGVRVHVVPRISWKGRPVSSGRIREGLAGGQLAAANAALGRPYSLTAQVVRGDGRGRTLGYPTANLALPEGKIVPPGVFAVRVALPGGEKKGGMANVGVRPTLARPDRKISLEVHLFGYQGNLVGRTLKVSFLKRLRGERKFPSLDALKKQLALDAKSARAAL